MEKFHIILSIIHDFLGVMGISKVYYGNRIPTDNASYLVILFSICNVPFILHLVMLDNFCGFCV